MCGTLTAFRIFCLLVSARYVSGGAETAKLRGFLGKIMLKPWQVEAESCHFVKKEVHLQDKKKDAQTINKYEKDIAIAMHYGCSVAGIGAGRVIWHREGHAPVLPTAEGTTDISMGMAEETIHHDLR